MKKSAFMSLNALLKAHMEDWRSLEEYFNDFLSNMRIL
jgi:hypothetical protein